MTRDGVCWYLVVTGRILNVAVPHAGVGWCDREGLHHAAPRHESEGVEDGVTVVAEGMEAPVGVQF